MKTSFISSFKTPAPLQPSHLPSLNGIRGLAIILVIIFHLHLSNGHKWFEVIFNGQLGVNLFFVLSGFLITTLCIKEKIATGDLSLKNFYLRRVLRILPLAYLFLIVVAILNLVFKLHIPLFQFLGAAFFILNLSYFRRHDLKSPIGHLWSLATEEQFYIIFPPIFKLSFRAYCYAIVFIVFVLPFICLAQEFLPAINQGILYGTTHMLIKFQGIAVGCLFSVLMFRFEKFSSMISLHKWLLNSLAIFFIFFLNLDFFYTIKAVFINLLISVLTGYLIVSNLKPAKDAFFAFLNNKLLSYIGVLSYSLYIWQQIFTMQQPWENAFKWGNSPILNTCVLVVVAWCSYNFFERKFLKLKKKFAVVPTLVEESQPEPAAVQS